MAKARNNSAEESEFRTSVSLIARVRDRTDVESWREFYEFYQPLLRRYLGRIGLKDHAASDVMQDVFVRLLQSLPTFVLDSKRGRFRSYLWRLTYTALVDQARRIKTRRQAEEAWGERFQIESDAESLRVQNELNEINQEHILAKALPSVRLVTSATAWTCFEQRLLRDRPGNEIAAELGISAKAVFVYASRVLKQVRKK